MQAERLSFEDITVTYSPHSNPVSAVRNVSLSVEVGHTLGIVGESGSGKSTMGLAAIHLLPKSAKITGRLMLNDEDLLRVPEKRMRAIRGRKIGLIFQDSLASLNPVFSIRSQFVQTIRQHDPEISGSEAARRAGDALEELDIPRDRLNAFPHELSGGMRQRIMIAMALAPKPSFVVADESTSDLDTISQRRILDLLLRVQKSRGLGLIIVSHDLGVVHHACEKVAVLYRGDLVEYGYTRQVLEQPQHEYTRGLVKVSRKQRTETGLLYTLPSRAAATAMKDHV
ncbi:ABC transporter ATP-binding protein [Sinorhizobium meliloti]|nr:ABC transporter ATP-binding protein [Sinorhizobium meliloti]